MALRSSRVLLQLWHPQRCDAGGFIASNDACKQCTDITMIILVKLRPCSPADAHDDEGQAARCGGGGGGTQGVDGEGLGAVCRALAAPEGLIGGEPA